MASRLCIAFARLHLPLQWRARRIAKRLQVRKDRPPNQSLHDRFLTPLGDPADPIVPVRHRQPRWRSLGFLGPGPLLHLSRPERGSAYRDHDLRYHLRPALLGHLEYHTGIRELRTLLGVGLERLIESQGDNSQNMALLAAVVIAGML